MLRIGAMLLRDCRAATAQLPCQIVSREASAALAASFKSASGKVEVKVRLADFRPDEGQRSPRIGILP